MKRTMHLLALGVACLFGVQTALAQPIVTKIGTDTDATDYSSTGLNYGQLGSWFPAWDLGALADPLTPASSYNNALNNLPAWVTFDINPNVAGYGFASATNPQLDNGDTVSRGGDVLYNSLKLPNSAGGTTGLSGSAYMNFAAVGNIGSENNIRQFNFGAGVPSSFFLRIVVDNTGTAATPHLSARTRIRGRDSAGNGGAFEKAEWKNDIVNNGIADVYTARFNGVVPGDYFRVQMRSLENNTTGNTNNGSGLGGIMFDAVPEPSSIALGLMGLASIVGIGLRRRRA